MALPTMPSYWSSRYKNIQERAMVQRRTHESDFREKWTDRAKSFNRAEVEMVKQMAWTSDQSFQTSMNAWKRHAEKDLRAVQLERRRSKLQRLLKEETDMYEAELRSLSKNNHDRLCEMRERSEEIKTSRESERKLIADDRMYEHWKQNNPDLRKMESERHKCHVITAWGDQTEENERKRQQEEADRQHLEDEMEHERLKGLEEDRRTQESRLANDKEMAAALKTQMNELKDREAEADKLKKQQADLERQQWELAKLKDERATAEEARKKQETNRVLSRQYKAQLRRKAQEVKEALEMDRKILESLAAEMAEDGQMKSARKEQARADAAWMKQVVEEQLRLEKAREAELDMLYRDEAARQWQKRESEWERERIARERLMAEVLQDRQQQLRQKMDENHQLQEESLERREELLREMEVAREMDREEEQERKRQKEQTKRTLGGQMTEHQLQKDLSRLQLEDDYQTNKEAEEVYKEMLRQEAETLDQKEYEPKSYARTSSRPNTRRSAWD